jgi:hypothetical protein
MSLWHATGYAAPSSGHLDGITAPDAKPGVVPLRSAFRCAKSTPLRSFEMRTGLVFATEGAAADSRHDSLAIEELKSRFDIALLEARLKAEELLAAQAMYL